LQVAIEIRERRRVTLEDQRIVAVVPPAMRGAGRKLRALASGHAQALAVQNRPERPGNHDAFFDFDVVNMERRPFVPRRERSLQFQGQHPVAHHAPQRERLTGMTVPDDNCFIGLQSVAA
jgi:hypothetical protein